MHPQPRKEMTSGRHSTAPHPRTSYDDAAEAPWNVGRPQRQTAGSGAEHSHERGLRPLSLPVRETPDEVIGLLFSVCYTRTRGLGE